MARYKIDQRIDEFEACASALGWSFKKEDEWGLIKWLLDFKLFRLGKRHKVTPLIIHESDDMGFTCSFDYIYTISSGKSSHTFRQTVYFRYSKALALPNFVMIPEKWYHRIGTYFGMQDIDFVQYPTFSKNYLLRGEDEDYIRYHFDNPDLIRFFDNQDFYSLEGMNYLMILYIHDVVMPRQQILQLVNIGTLFIIFLQGKHRASNYRIIIIRFKTKDQRPKTKGIWNSFIGGACPRLIIKLFQVATDHLTPNTEIEN